ncbi:dimethyl sulfoxide reductase anchor subunit family protein [Oricola indica]|uniref:dimethyl sulfoxide reductase anchor subunit family protein n=1 Tax=Oricola indica TaxID=2872591 RepID=UPI003CCBFC72
MHPAVSLLLFTTLSGAGFGLIAWTGLGFGPTGTWFAWLDAFVAGLLVTVGLSASAMHLRRPDRAWRAFSQWRSSWLSREAVLAAATSAVFGVYALIWIFTGARLLPLGIVATLLSAITVYATSMIYTQLRTVPRWATPLTPAVFLAFAAAGGALVLSVLEGGRSSPIAAIALFALVLAWIIKAAWWQRAMKTTRASAGASPEQATGLGNIGTVSRFELPHTGSNYLLREMVFQVARRRARAVRRLAFLFGAALPAVLLLIFLTFAPSPALPVLALVSHFAGLLCERWLFFAEAEHAVGAYYGAR